MRRDNTTILVGTRLTLCKKGSDLCAKKEATKIFDDEDSWPVVGI